MLYFLRGDFDPVVFITFLVVAFFAFAYHEFGHAIVADRLGDITPRQNGRITLNPLPHISWFGFLMLALVGIGWATTPINERLLRGNPRTSHMIVALAGPAANLVMALLFALPLRLLSWGLVDLQAIVAAGVPEQVVEIVFRYCLIGVRLNLFLIAFNLLPIPPLDGFWVLRGLLPPDLAVRLEMLYPYGFYMLLAVFLLLPQLGVSVFPAIDQIVSIGFSLLTGFPVL